MKTIKFTRQTLLITLISGIMTAGIAAKTIDVSNSIKDIRIMTRIMEASLESSSKDFPGILRIDGTYLATQGYLFNIRLNGIGVFGIPGIALWDGGRLELDIPEIITEALASIDYDEMLAPVSPLISDAILDPLEQLYDNDELQESLRELREKQRDIRREVYQNRRDIRKAIDADKRKVLAEQLENNQDSLKQYAKQYINKLNAYKNDRKIRRIKKSNDVLNAVFATICDYGQSLRALKKDEKFTLMIKGGVDAEGNKATQVYVIEQAALKNCSDSKKLKNKSIHYSL